MRSILVIGEIAVAVLLLCGAGLLLRTRAALDNVDPGYRADNVLTMQVALEYGLPSSHFANEESLKRFFTGSKTKCGRCLVSAASPGAGRCRWTVRFSA